ncbi:hypothetical protein O3P69_016332 [Scylla paramamosain]|uniref:Uncharacterized protein n=1 Tax=Scylla paramamosain TaxID=85552 RepID=A0AAW0TF51_SCYPA
MQVKVQVKCVQFPWPECGSPCGRRASPALLLVVVVWWWCWREWLDKTPHTHDFRFAERRKMWIGLLVDGAHAWVCGGWVGGGAVLRWAARQVDGGGPASLRALAMPIPLNPPT